MDALIVRLARADERGVAALIQSHFELMRASSPEESCHVMPGDALAAERAHILAVQRNDDVLGIGAIKELRAGHGEIKSMHTMAEARGQGIARVVLRELVARARQQGMTRLSLETGSAEMFAPARNLYLSEGFKACPPFGEYAEDPLSVFMTRAI